MASHGGAQKQPDTPRQIWRVLGCFQTCGGHPRKASSSSRPDQRSFVPLAKRCIRNITSREMYSGVPLEKRRYRRRLDLARQPCSSQTSAKGLPIHLRIWSFFCRNSGRPLMLPIALHGCRARSNLRRLSTVFQAGHRNTSHETLCSELHRLAKGATDRWSGREEYDALRACLPQVWKQPTTRHI